MKTRRHFNGKSGGFKGRWPFVPSRLIASPLGISIKERKLHPFIMFAFLFIMCMIAPPSPSDILFIWFYITLH